MVSIFRPLASRRAWVSALAILGLAAALAFAVPASRSAILSAAGWTLVAIDPLTSTDIVIVGVGSGASGVLEAADLVAAGVASRVAVFADPPVLEDLEFVRRGLPYEDTAARSMAQLSSLGVKDVIRIPRAADGTEAEGEVLPEWCNERQFRSVVIVTTSDHSRRLRRVLARAMKNQPTHVSVRPSRYSRFDPDRWWHSRDGARTLIIEAQKLFLDVVRHPF